MSEPGVPPPPMYTPPPPPAGPPGSAVSPNRNIMIVLSYLGLLCLIPLLAEKEDSEVQWHAKNGLALFLADIVFWIAVVIVMSVLGRMFGFGCFVGLIFRLVQLAPLALSILCIVKGVNGQRFIIPGVSQFAERF